MLKCKNCGEKLTKFNKEICPYCGCLNPIEDSVDDSDTTRKIDILNDYSSDIKESFTIRKHIFIILSFFVGIFGIQFIYIKKYKLFLINLLLSLSLFLIIFLSLFLNINNVVLSIILPLIFCYLIEIVITLILIFNKKYQLKYLGVVLN